jgi:hypothetical protein
LSGEYIIVIEEKNEEELCIHRIDPGGAVDRLRASEYPTDGSAHHGTDTISHPGDCRAAD